MDDLTSISTFGWFSGVSVVDQLKPISTFGWWFDLGDDTSTSDIYPVSFNLTRLILIDMCR